MLEHLAKDREEYRDKRRQHQEQYERDATAGNKRLNSRRTVVVAIHTDRGNGAEDERQDPCDNVGDQTRQKLGKERSAEQLGLVVLKRRPDLVERKRALDTTGHRKVHHGNVGEHLKEDPQDRRGNHSQDKQAKRAKQRCLECIGAVIRIRARGANYHALHQRKHYTDNGNGSDNLEHDRDNARKDSEAKRRGTHEWTVHAVIDLERKITAPLDTKAGTAHARNASCQKADGSRNAANNGNKQHEHRHNANQRRQKRDLAYTLKHTRSLGHILERLSHTALWRIRHGRLRNKLLGLRLSLGSGSSGTGIRSTTRAAELVVIAHGGATLRAEHRIIPSYLERITWIANDVFSIIIAQCGVKYSKMTDLQGTRRQQAVR